MINNMDMEKKLGQMEHGMRVNILKERSKVKGNFIGQIILLMKVLF